LQKLAQTLAEIVANILPKQLAQYVAQYFAPIKGDGNYEYYRTSIHNLLCLNQLTTIHE